MAARNRRRTPTAPTRAPARRKDRTVEWVIGGGLVVLGGYFLARQTGMFGGPSLGAVVGQPVLQDRAVVARLAIDAGATAAQREAVVETMQAQLNALGATPPLVVDGDVGPRTRAAVTAFATANRLPASDSDVPVILAIDSAYRARRGLPAGA